MDELLEDIEDRLLVNPTNQDLDKIKSFKRKMIVIHRSSWPTREVIGSLTRIESSLLMNTTEAYYRDLYEHVIQIIDTTEVLRDLIGGMLDIYLSSVSNRMNEIMKVLTIFSVIFIPLSFIVGFYGMNLKMPELQYPIMYPLVIVLMIGVVVFMLRYFKKKNWL